MTSLYHAQGWTLAGSGRPVSRHGLPASVVAHDHSNARSSSLRAARCEKPRANCRGFAASASFFPAGCIDLDAIAAVRARLAAGLRPEQAAALDTIADQLPRKLSDPLRSHFVRRLSLSVASDVKQPIERHLEACSLFKGIEYPR